MSRQKRFLSAVSKLGLEFPVAEISRKTGYTEGTISPYLKPEGKASSKFIQSVADAFGINAFEIFNNNEESLDKQEITHPLITSDVWKDKYYQLLEEERNVVLGTANAAIEAAKAATRAADRMDEYIKKIETTVADHSENLSELNSLMLGIQGWGLQFLATQSGRPFEELQKELGDYVDQVHMKSQRTVRRS